MRLNLSSLPQKDCLYTVKYKSEEMRHLEDKDGANLHILMYSLFTITLFIELLWTVSSARFQMQNGFHKKKLKKKRIINDTLL